MMNPWLVLALQYPYGDYELVIFGFSAIAFLSSTQYGCQVVENKDKKTKTAEDARWQTATPPPGTVASETQHGVGPCCVRKTIHFRNTRVRLFWNPERVGEGRAKQMVDIVRL